jgi:RNA recognition motif-containing protein
MIFRQGRCRTARLAAAQERPLARTGRAGFSFPGTPQGFGDPVAIGKVLTMVIRINSLPFETTAEDLRAMFERHGEVGVVKVAQYRGESAGYGHVEMIDADAGQRAIEALNRTTLGGRIIRLVKDTENVFYYSPGYGGYPIA